MKERAAAPASSRWMSTPIAVFLAALVAVPGCRSPDSESALEVGHVYGSATAPVTVIEFSDFGCPFCRMFAVSTFPELQREYVESGRVRWIYVPIVTGSFPNGNEAARAGECAADQDRFPEMKDRLYISRADWTGTNRPAEVFAAIARDLDLDAAAFATCYNENAPAGRIRYNNLAASAAGIRATPTFVVDGRLIEGALPLERFRDLLDERLTGPR